MLYASPGRDRQSSRWDSVRRVWFKDPHSAGLFQDPHSAGLFQDPHSAGLPADAEVRAFFWTLATRTLRPHCLRLAEGPGL